MRHWEIRDIDGTVLHSGAAKTRRAFIASLVKQAAAVKETMSLAGADLGKADLSGLDLQGVDLTGAYLADADLRGAQLQGAVLRRANLTGARLQGARLDRARLESADLSRAHLTGARMTYANFRGAILNKADFSKASASSCVFSHVKADEADFSGAWLVNSDFGNSTVVNSDFSGAHLQHRMFGGQSCEVAETLSQHLPNRTRYSVIVGCSYDKNTVMADTVPAFLADARTNRMARFGLWAATTLGMVTAGAHVPDLLSETALASHFGKGAGFVAVLGGLYLLKEGVGTWLEDTVKDGLDLVVRKVRETMNEVNRLGTHRMNLVVAMARDGSAEPLRRALAATTPDARRRGFWDSFKAFWCDLGQVIICDRRHLAMALGSLSSNRRRSYSLPRDMVLVRCGAVPGGIGPSVIGFLKDGRTTAVWQREDESTVTTLYDADNVLSGCWGADGQPLTPEAADLPECYASGLESVFRFEESLLEDHGLDEFTYPKETHYLQAGRDGTLLVHRVADRRLDNPSPGAPAIVRTDGTGFRVKNGSLQEEWQASADAVTPHAC